MYLLRWSVRNGLKHLIKPLLSISLQWLSFDIGACEIVIG